MIRMGGADAVMLSNETPSAYMHTYKMDSWFSTGQVFDGSSVNITLWSYCQDANLCIMADEKVIPDGWVPYNYFVEELDTLLALTPAAAEETRSSVQTGQSP